jgi:hypothetical protein
MPKIHKLKDGKTIITSSRLSDKRGQVPPISTRDFITKDGEFKVKDSAKRRWRGKEGIEDEVREFQTEAEKDKELQSKIKTKYKEEEHGNSEKSD